MKTSPRPSEARPPELIARLEAYAARHRSLENYVLAYFVIFGVLRRIGVEPRSALGRVATGLLVATILFGVPFVASLVAGDLHGFPYGTVFGSGLAFGLLGASFHDPFSEAIDTSLALQRAMIDPVGVDRLVAFDRRWFRIAPALVFGGGFASAMLALLVVSGGLARSSLSAGAITLAAMFLYQVGEITYAVLVLGVESRILREYDYELYRLSPLDSLSIRRSLRGSSALGLLVCLVATAFIAGFAILFRDHARLAAHATFVLLLVAYLAMGLGMLMPRLAILRVVRAEKEREMAPLQVRIDALVARAFELDASEQKELQRLQEVHDAIRDAPESVLPIGSVGQVASALFLPTVTYAISQAREEVADTLLHLLGR